jgi:hypothetical protein
MMQGDEAWEPVADIASNQRIGGSAVSHPMCPACVPRRTARRCEGMVTAGQRSRWSEAFLGAFAMLL